MAYQSKKDKNKEYALIKAKKIRLESGHDVKLYLTWMNMAPMEQRTAYVVWDEYYKQVRNTRAYSLNREMSEAIKKENAPKIAELRKESYAMRDEQLEGRRELLLPNVINPYDFTNKTSVKDYKWACREIKRLEGESLDMEVAGVFN